LLTDITSKQFGTSKHKPGGLQLRNLANKQVAYHKQLTVTAVPAQQSTHFYHIWMLTWRSC